MYRVGIYSGRVYSQTDFDNGKIKECAIVYHSKSEARSATKTSRFRNSHQKCEGCHNCPESNKLWDYPVAKA